MYLLRRAAFRAVSASSSVLAKSRPTVASPSPLLILQKQLARPAIQVRLYSDETRKPIDAFAESGKESTNEAQTSPPAVEETPASTIDETATTSAPLSNRSSSSGGSILYVGNMFFEVTEEQLRALFSKFGTVKAAKILYDQRGLSKGYGFVTFATAEDARAAQENLHQQVHEGRLLVVQPTKSDFKGERRDNRIARNPNPPSNSIFIGNMSFEMSDKDLNDMFRDVKNVLDVRVAIDRRTGRPRGFAHADFVDVASATAAKELLSQKEIYGRKLRVDFSKSIEVDKQTKRNSTGETTS